MDGPVPACIAVDVAVVAVRGNLVGELGAGARFGTDKDLGFFLELVMLRVCYKIWLSLGNLRHHGRWCPC